MLYRYDMNVSKTLRPVNQVHYNYSTPLPGMAVPPMLETALGCFSKHRYILFYSYLNGDIVWTDGQKSCLVYWPAWCLYCNSPAISLHLRHHTIPLLEKGAPYGLVLDRDRRRFSLDHPDCFSLRLGSSVDGLKKLSIQSCVQFELADELTQQIAKYMY